MLFACVSVQIWDEFVNMGTQQLRATLNCRSLVDWVVDIKRNKMVVAMRDFVDGENDSGRFCIHPNCVDMGWNMPVAGRGWLAPTVPTGNGKKGADYSGSMLCQTCLTQVEEERVGKAKDLAMRRRKIKVRVAKLCVCVHVC